MQTINITKLNKIANRYVFSKNGAVIAFEVVYYFIQSLYTIVKIATFGLVSIITSTILFPYTVQKSKRRMQLIENKKIDKFYKSILIYLNIPFCIKIFILNIIAKILIYFSAIFFVVPAITISNRLTLLSFVVAKKPKQSIFTSLKQTFKITKNQTPTLFAAFSPYIFYSLLSILTLGISNFYFANKLFNLKALIYLNLNISNFVANPIA